jgi:hypothetical protein
VLCYRDGKRRGGIVRRHYEPWRQQQKPPLPERCDIEECFFHSNPLVWNGHALKLILDHQNGNNTDNRPNNLRFLCPNCNSQQIDTNGGANKGRVRDREEGKVTLVSKDGKLDFQIFPSTGQLAMV